MPKKKKVDIEQQFRDGYANDPAGFLFAELVAANARIDILEEIVTIANPVVSKLFGFGARIAALEGRLYELGKTKEETG